MPSHMNDPHSVEIGMGIISYADDADIREIRPPDAEERTGSAPR